MTKICKPDKDIHKFIDLYKSINPGIDKAIFAGLVDFVTKHPDTYYDHPILQQMINRWYTSLNKGQPDYTVYNDPYYVVETWISWAKYSSKYLWQVATKKALPDDRTVLQMLHEKGIQSVLDMGCGIGYTTSYLCDLFPQSTVIGTNLQDTKDWHFCEYMQKDNNFLLYNETDNPSCMIDLIVAFEFFEHLERPLEYIQKILELKPKYLLIANSFNTYALGHFVEYRDRNHLLPIPQAQISRKFNATLRQQGYEKVETSFWNSRPSLWERKLNQMS